MKTLTFLPNQEGFLGVKEEYLENTDDAKAVVVPFGLECSVTYGHGTRAGPRAIIKASHQIELFDEKYWCESFRKIGVVTLKEINIENNLENAIAQIEGVTQKILNANKFPLILGGEHSLTIGAIKPFVKKYPDLAILHFGAHADLGDIRDGKRYSNTTVMRRVMESDISTLVSCGVRNISADGVKYLEANKDRINIHWGKDRKEWDIKEIIKPLKNKPVYITFDLASFDSSLMQATGEPEPGGLFWSDAMKLINEVAKCTDLVGADIVELAPIRQLHSCDFLAAKLCYKILGAAFLGKSS